MSANHPAEIPADSRPQPSYLSTQSIQRLQGPVLVLGASGFIGANLFRSLLAVRDDVYGTVMHQPAWRLRGIPAERILQLDLLIEANLDSLLATVKPRTIFNCVAFGAYSFETDSQLIHQTNFILPSRLLERLAGRNVTYIHAGSSSEYGDQSAGPDESSPLSPNSAYAVSKAAAANLIHYFGKHRGLRCANLRLYSVYGPLEDSSRLIPQVLRRGIEGRHAEYVRPDISRDFIDVDDASAAFVATALNLQPEDHGASFNIGSGAMTTIADVARLADDLFQIPEPPQFTMPARDWDVRNWYANPARARARLDWDARIPFHEGLQRMRDWYAALEDKSGYERSSKKYGLDMRHSVSAVIACYKDGQAIPIMHQRLKAVFEKLNVDHEIIFVNDGSPDDSEEVIRQISRQDRNVLGISHSRNFGSQAAFMSGMRAATKSSCVLLDGDLQDPPEVIAEFVEKWREGYDVVYGRRVKREATLFMQFAYKAFYRVFNWFSYVAVPHDAGDFALLDRRVVRSLLQFPERDLFLRGVRAYAGFRQTGVDYFRPERMFGRSTNNLVKNLEWAKKGILSFSHTPLNLLSVLGAGLLVLTFVLGVAQVLLRLLRPDWVPQGVTTVLLAIMFFGSLSIFSTAVLGEYLAKVFEEVKARPLYIRRSIIRDGEVRDALHEPLEGPR